VTEYAGPIRRVKYGRGHGYRDARGATVPGVTTILGDGLAKPALINWAATTTAGYAVDHWDELAELKPSERLKKLEKARYEDLDAAGNKGTAVHKLAEKLVKGEQVNVPDELAGHIRSYVRFLDEEEPEAVIVEGVVMSHRHGYAGTLDLIADFPRRGQRLLADIKTARSGVFPDNALQLAGYRYADAILVNGQERPMLPVDGAVVVHVRADGYSVVPVEAGPTEFRYFLYCQQLWRWVNEHSRTVVGEVWDRTMEASA
jgi:hypothetical protein